MGKFSCQDVVLINTIQSNQSIKDLLFSNTLHCIVLSLSAKQKNKQKNYTRTF